jgi:hypothetical protein
MRKWIVLTVVFLCLAIAGPAQALGIYMTDSNPKYWGTLTVKYDGLDGGAVRSVGAGRFHTTLVYEDKEIDTFSYCVDLGKYFTWGQSYSANKIDIDPDKNELNYAGAAWLVSQFDPFIGTYWTPESDDMDARSVAMTLQLAIWKTLYGSEFSRESGGDYDLFNTMTNHPIPVDFDASGFFVADIDGQDQLVAAPVPEPATMLLMGIGLLGLGVVGRKRIK